MAAFSLLVAWANDGALPHNAGSQSAPINSQQVDLGEAIRRIDLECDGDETPGLRDIARKERRWRSGSMPGIAMPIISHLIAAES
jgi:hypothetical protein